MKKWLVLFVSVFLLFSFTGCLRPPTPEPQKDPLEIYASMNHGFLEELMEYFKSTQVESLDISMDGQIAMEVLKVLGKVAQVAGKVKSNVDKKAFEDTVLSDLTAIKEQLDILEKQVADGFNSVNAKLAESEALDTWNSMCDNHLIVIDTAWNHYLNPNGIEGLINILDKTEEPATATYQSAVNSFINAIEGVGVYNIEQAMLDIRQHITGEHSYSKILNQAVDYLALQNINNFKTEGFLDELLASYLNFYMQMINYELKGTILLAEYYNYTEVDPDNVILSDNEYVPVTSDTAKTKIESFIYDFKVQISSFTNCGERLISQFNRGDIYREYDYEDKLVRNSDYYPYIDSFIRLAYGFENVFVFRLAWSEELISHDPDQLINLDGSSYASIDYSDLYNGLGGNLYSDVRFALKDGDSYHYPEIDEVNQDNLSCISKFKLYVEGDSTKSFSSGVRRYVFEQLPDNRELELFLDYYNSGLLPEHFTFTYSPIVNEEIYLYAAKDGSEFEIDELLTENNPLEDFNNTQPPKVVSFTFGAYMSKYEFMTRIIEDELRKIYIDLSLYSSSMTYEQQSELFYGATTERYYYVETSGNQHIEVNDDKEILGVTVVPVNHTTTSGVKDGDEVVMYLVYSHNGKSHHGYMYQNSHDQYSPIKFKEGMDNAIRFTMHKKYVYPSGKLYSNEKVNKMNLFVIETGDVCAHAKPRSDDSRLEFYSTDYNQEANWFFFKAD